jgi:hypothetical protein
LDLSELAAYAEEKFDIREQFKWAEFPGFSVLAEPYTGKWVALLMRLREPETGEEIQRCDIKCGIQTLNEVKAPYLSHPFRMKGEKWLGVSFDNRTEADVIFRLFDRAVHYGEQRGYTLILDDVHTENTAGTYQETSLPISGRSSDQFDSETPLKIQEMTRLYHHRDNSFRQKCKNFYRQGKFMENYEDDAPWDGNFQHYFPTYHDLNIKQLRGYFTWRTNIRKGNWQPISPSLAYIYIYELLNGIGADTIENRLQKMKSFETNYLDSGMGDTEMRKNLHRWMLELSVIHNLPSETAREFADREMLRKDMFLLMLRDPKEHSDEEIYDALNALSGDKLALSPVIKNNEAKGKHLFAEIWRYASQFCFQNNKNLFVSCFGSQNTYHWYPLANAVYYWREDNTADYEYDLTDCRKYIRRGGMWMEKKYESISFEKKRFQSLLHESDRLLRKYMNTGHILKAKPEESWASPYAEAVIEIDRKMEIEASKPKITIDLSSLEKIRLDALQTRDNLLTEEELADFNITDSDIREDFSDGKSSVPADTESISITNTVSLPIGPLQIQILQMLLRGESPSGMIKEQHLIPSVLTDEINEALFDEIGDSILECDNDIITLVEDYKEDIISLLGA